MKQCGELLEEIEKGKVKAKLYGRHGCPGGVWADQEPSSKLQKLLMSKNLPGVQSVLLPRQPYGPRVDGGLLQNDGSPIGKNGHEWQKGSGAPGSRHRIHPSILILIPLLGFYIKPGLRISPVFRGNTFIKGISIGRCYYGSKNPHKPAKDR